MVSGLKFFEQDPMYPRKNRGRGYYYKRGNLSTGAVRRGQRNPANLRGEYWSKYNDKIDAKKPYKPTRVKNVTQKEKTQPHKADYKTRSVASSSSNKVKAYNGGYIKDRKTPRLDSGVRGYF